MAMLRPASEMKDSGIEWMGRVPKDWKVSRIGNYYCFNSGDSLTNEAIVDDKRDDYFPVYGANGLRGYYVRNNLNDKHILLGRVGALCGNVHIVNEPVWVTEHALIAKKKQLSNDEYNGYVFESMDLIQYSKASAQPVISASTLTGLRIPVPSMVEQQAIADYLDDRCSKIDEIIAEATASIEEYKELKQAVIFEAVTKGLDKSVPMRQSNVGWIDRVPCSWNVGKLRLLAEFYNGDRSSRYPSGDDIKSEGIIFVTSNNLGNIRLNIDIPTNKYITKEKYDELGGAKLRIDDIVFCLRGSVGKCSINKIFDAGTIASSLVVIRPKKINPDYLNYVLQTSRITDEAIVSAIGIGSANLAAHDISEFFVPVPSKAEQQEIVDFLDVRVGDMDALISEKQALIDDLQAYKKSLIYEVVTGKRRVV